MPLMITGHMINSSSATSAPHPSTIIRGRCLTSVAEKLPWQKIAYDIHCTSDLPNNLSMHGYLYNSEK